MTDKRHHVQRWFSPPKSRHNRTAQILNHWLNETVFGFEGFGFPFGVDCPLEDDA